MSGWRWEKLKEWIDKRCDEESFAVERKMEELEKCCDLCGEMLQFGRRCQCDDPAFGKSDE